MLKKNNCYERNDSVVEGSTFVYCQTVYSNVAGSPDLTTRVILDCIDS